MHRRQLLKVLAGLGIGTAAFQRALAAQAAGAATVSAEMIKQAEWISGIELSEEERETTARSLTGTLRKFEAMRTVDVDYNVPPAVVFSAAPTRRQSTKPHERSVAATEGAAGKRSASTEALAFLPITELSALIRTHQVTSIELTKLYLERLRQYDPALLCVATLTEDLALKQAERADREIASGRYRGPLHGIPWGAKDLIAYPGYKTAWGATPFVDQVRDEKATVARRLDEAGAVLVAKLSLGSLAMGDEWYRGKTRNPWNQKQGSSGSSAGSASATAAGLVGFAIGSETLGSIVSPCRRCGTSGLRPTFGRVSRYGCMSLSWSMDKLGPITRSMEDCALVFAAIHGYDGLDPTAVDQPFHWPPRRDLRTMRVGYVVDKTPIETRSELKTLRELGVELVPIELPKKYPAGALTVILDTEAAAVFDPLTREGISEGIGKSWPGIFRRSEFVPAVEYLRANRIRTLLMQEMAELMSGVDAYVGGNDLTITNLTGHPTIVMPHEFGEADGVETPGSITFTGKLFGETDLLTLGHAFQQATGHHLKHPSLEKLIPIDQG